MSKRPTVRCQRCETNVPIPEGWSASAAIRRHLLGEAPRRDDTGKADKHDRADRRRTLRKEEFYNERTTIGSQRNRSGEVDYGVMWRDGLGHPRWRVTYVVTTGEVYASKGEEAYIVIGQLQPNDKDAAEEALAGWTEAIHTENGIDWVRERIDAWNGEGQTPTLQRCPACGSEDITVEVTRRAESHANSPTDQTPIGIVTDEQYTAICNQCGAPLPIGPLTKVGQ